MSRSALDRMLRRHCVSNLRDLLPKEETPAPKKFKKYDPGYVHVDVKYLPKMADETTRKYLYVAIDRATRWVYHEVLPDETAKSAAGFLGRVIQACPIKITKVLTDNGSDMSSPTASCTAASARPQAVTPLTGSALPTGSSTA